MGSGDTGERSGTGDLSRRAFWTLAFGLPVLLLTLHRQAGHQGDLRFFFEWYRAFAESPAFYRDGPGVNYPILGVLWLCLPARLVDAFSGTELTFEGYRDTVKLTLTASEVLLIAAASWLAAALGAPRPRTLAIALYLLPSTWADGSWFGQIDVIGSVLLLVAAAGAVRYSSAASSSMLLVTLAGLHGAILTKQLCFFSIPGLAAILAFALYLGSRTGGRGAWWHPVVVLASPALWFAADPLLTLPEGYSSHLAFVLTGGGSSHGDVICASGVNLWTLIYPGNPVSSVETLLAGVPVRTWAIVLYALVQLFLLACFALEALRQPQLDGERTAKVMSHGVLLVGVSNLAMATLMTGVHERYLVHALPFLVLGLAARTRDGAAWRAVFLGSWLVGAWSGLFVLSTIHWEVFSRLGILAPFRSPVAVGVPQIVLLVVLLTLCARQCFTSRDPRSDTRGSGPGASR